MWSNDIFTGTLELKKEYFKADKTITCSVTHGYSTLEATASADNFGEPNLNLNYVFYL